MSSNAATTRELDAFREQGEQFTAELLEEAYLHYSGLKESYEVEAIYDRHAELSKLETAQKLKNAPSELRRFACECYLGNLTRSHQETVAAAEASLETTVDGETIPYRMLRVEISNEADRGRRERLERERVRLLDEELNPVYLEAARIDHEAVRKLDTPNLYELYNGFGYRLDELAAECRGVLDETEALWEREADRLFRSRLGVSLAEARPWDVPRLWRAPELDRHYPPDRMLPALEGTLGDLGVDLRTQANVELDIESRPNKTPRAFCAAIEVPGRVMLVIQPIGGMDDWAALFHEAGHTEHLANTAADATFEARRLGDPAVSEGWAALLEHLVTEPAWLNRRLDVAQPDELAREGAVSDLYFARRYSAKLLYEIEFFQTDDPGSMKDRYYELLSDAVKLPVHPESYLDDMDGGFYVTGYLRSWAFEAQLRDFLRGEFGKEWFARRSAGDLLRELWSLGQGPTADEMIRDLTGGGLEMASVTARARERLAAS